MDWQTIISTALGTLVGVIAGWMATDYYARQGSQELRREAEGLKRETARLQRHTTLLLRGLEEAGLVEWTYNEKTGEIEGIKIKARLIVGAKSDVSITATKRKGNDAPADQE